MISEQRLGVADKIRNIRENDYTPNYVIEALRVQQHMIDIHYDFLKSYFSKFCFSERYFLSVEDLGEYGNGIVISERDDKIIGHRLEELEEFFTDIFSYMEEAERVIEGNRDYRESIKK